MPTRQVSAPGDRGQGAGYAAALGKSHIVLHDPRLTHPLKEVDAAAHAVAEPPEQAVRLLNYVIDGKR